VWVVLGVLALLREGEAMNNMVGSSELSVPPVEGEAMNNMVGSSSTKEQ